ncbi:predicted protein [Botrytis cinerea T4]|uniref:Uncharacterized protein n=1 Tax=Botryotinia fuckeliana (strain T4) TaxID=999810 RepID=G2XP19_BOTF4|nr:predicted protein [Botrytis cinerea T4]
MDGERLHKSIFKIKEARCQMEVTNAYLPMHHHPGDETWEIYRFIRPYTKQIVPEFKLQGIWLDFCKDTRLYTGITC